MLLRQYSEFICEQKEVISMSNYFESFEEAMYAILEAFYDAFTRGGSKQSFSVHFPRDGMSKDEVLNNCNSEMSNAVMSSVYGLSPEGNLIALHIEPAPIEDSCIRLGRKDVQLTIPIRFRHYYSLPYLDKYVELTEDEFEEKAFSLLATYSKSEFEEKLEEERSALDSEDDESERDEYGGPEYDESDEFDLVYDPWMKDYFGL